MNQPLLPSRTSKKNLLINTKPDEPDQISFQEGIFFFLFKCNFNH